jgi:hypothetical protein
LRNLVANCDCSWRISLIGLFVFTFLALVHGVDYHFLGFVPGYLFACLWDTTWETERPERIVRLMRMRKDYEIQKRDLFDWFGGIKCVLSVGLRQAFRTGCDWFRACCDLSSNYLVDLCDSGSVHYVLGCVCANGFMVAKVVMTKM